MLTRFITRYWDTQGINSSFTVSFSSSTYTTLYTTICLALHHIKKKKQNIKTSANTTFCVMLDWDRLLKMKAIFSWTFSGGSTILSVWSVATSNVSMFVVFIDGCKAKENVFHSFLLTSLPSPHFRWDFSETSVPPSPPQTTRSSEWTNPFI